MTHFLKGRCNEPGQADDIHVLFECGIQYGFSRDHDAKINNFIVIAAQHHADDFFTDIVDVTLYGGHKDTDQAFVAGTRLAFFLFNIRDQHRHGLFHDTCTFDHLWQKHAPVTKQVTHHVHAIHQRTFDNVQRLRAIQSGFLGILLDVGIDTLDQCVLQPVFNRSLPPRLIDCLGFTYTLKSLSQFEQTVGRVLTAIQYDVFHGFT